MHLILTNKHNSEFWWKFGKINTGSIIKSLWIISFNNSKGFSSTKTLTGRHFSCLGKGKDPRQCVVCSEQKKRKRVVYACENAKFIWGLIPVLWNFIPWRIIPTKVSYNYVNYCYCYERVLLAIYFLPNFNGTISYGLFE